MSATLDSFLGTPAPQQSTSTAESHCIKCGKAMSKKEPWYWRRKKGTTDKTELHCRDCAKKILKPQENTEEVEP